MENENSITSDKDDRIVRSSNMRVQCPVLVSPKCRVSGPRARKSARPGFLGQTEFVVPPIRCSATLC
jgi:hypothetical protein